MVTTYSLNGYGNMITDTGRMEAFHQALQQTVTPDSIVVDIGSGTGILALLACQCGARRVYAIEPGDVIQVGWELAAANGYAQRIEFIQALSTQVTLPEPADVIVSDLRGTLSFFQHIIPAAMDARRRFLAPGGRLIPQRDILWAAVLEAPELYQSLLAPWNGDFCGLNLSLGWRLAANSYQKAEVKPEQLLVVPRFWATLDFATVESPDVAADIAWTVTRPGIGHGLLLWFDCILAPGIGFSNAPGEPDHVYGRTFFPWLEPVPLISGETVSVSLHADLVGDDYIWRWDTRIRDVGGQVKADFRQSTFFGDPLSPAKLRQMASDHVPALAKDGQIDRLILELMDGQTSLGDIARRLVAECPHRFASEREALTRVGELSLKYGRQPESKYLKDE
jgi:type I protein arginine methyltransferase